MLPKNENTHIAKNYRPIACQNLMFKLYTSCINTFVQQHCEMNNIVTTEQAGGKRGVWGCLEQLLINKTVLNEVKQNRRNLVTVWLDYQKAFDSVPHEWLIESLKLAKLPPLIVTAIDTLTKSWATNIHISGENVSFTSNLIEYKNGIFQGDGLSVLWDVGQLYQQYVINTKSQKFTEKQMHGYLFKKVKEQDQINKSTSWTTDKYITSHFEGYAFAIHEQEINTKDLQYRRDIKSGKTPWQNNKCRLCNYCVEDITHVISSCSKMSSRYYLPLRHDVIAKTVYNEILRKENPDRKKLINNETEFITTVNDKELWWNVAVKTSSKVPHNRPDMIVWDMTKKLCYIIEFSCPADINIVNKVSEKENIYGPLIRNMQMMYENYSFMFIPIIVGALGHVPKCIFTNIENLGFTKNKTKKLVKKLQVLSVTGTVKICKTFMSFKV